MAARTLERCLTFGGPGSSSEIEAITVAPQPGLKEPSEKEHLGEILSLARAILRELQAPRPLQVFAPNREIRALLRDGAGPVQVFLARLGGWNCSPGAPMGAAARGRPKLRFQNDSGLPQGPAGASGAA